MDFFRKIDLDLLSEARLAIDKELSAHEDAWLVNQTRQHRVKVQRHTQSIWFRSADKDKEPGKDVDDVQMSRPSRLSLSFPTTMAVLAGFASDLSGELSRAIAVRLAPGSVVYPHIDHGAYYKRRDRYHFVVDSPMGSPMRAGSEEVMMSNGELWWFNNKVIHGSQNLSESWRIHVIFDLLPNHSNADRSEELRSA